MLDLINTRLFTTAIIRNGLQLSLSCIKAVLNRLAGPGETWSSNSHWCYIVYLTTFKRNVKQYQSFLIGNSVRNIVSILSFNCQRVINNILSSSSITLKAGRPKLRFSQNWCFKQEGSIGFVWSPAWTGRKATETCLCGFSVIKVI